MLDYGDRPDVLSDGRPGFDLRTDRRLVSLKVLSNGLQVRRYDLDYEDGVEISRLARVSWRGVGDAGPYPIDFRFEYTGALGAGCPGQGCGDPVVVKLPTPLGLDFRSRLAELVDLNGDGLPDVVDTSGPGHRIFANHQGSDGSQDFDAAISSVATAFRLDQPGVQTIDLDGDGHVDLVDGVSQQVLFNRGTGDWDPPESLPGLGLPDFSDGSNLRFFDWDDDKRIDILYSDRTSTWVYRNVGGKGFLKDDSPQAVGLGFASDNLQLADMNGDGLLDLAQVTPDLIQYRLYLGW